ncbi:protein arginine kinase [bacterium]|nr:protein arginine kinase [bacterium]
MMQLIRMCKKKSKWWKEKGPFFDVVISSRIRLARNLSLFPFPHKANNAQQKEILEKSEKAIKVNQYMKDSQILRFSELDKIDLQLLMERHLISYEHSLGQGYGGVAIDKKEVVSIMINEEDHLRLQVIYSGLQLFKAWALATKIDDKLNEKINYAFSHQWGYLTACPTNVGTGLRVSCMMHLPVLVLTRKIDAVLRNLSKIGFVVRGLYGEGTEVMGDLFQISNAVTLGQSEESIIDNIERVIKPIIEFERQSRIKLMEKNKVGVEDMIYRAYGILKYIRSITFSETMDLLSKIRLGLYLNLNLDCDISLVNELMILSQSAHIQELIGKPLSVVQRDELRAELIRKSFKK